MGLDFAGAGALGRKKRGVSSSRFVWVVPENNIILSASFGFGDLLRVGPALGV
jgi:hypothetical protein